MIKKKSRIISIPKNLIHKKMSTNMNCIKPNKYIIRMIIDQGTTLRVKCNVSNQMLNN